MSLHERLRDATASAHQALERDLDWQTRVATRDGYVGLIARLRGFHAVYETAIGAALSDEAFFEPRRRLAHLDADLAWFGLDAQARLALPMPADPMLDGPAAAMGALYVFEGSTLGGQFIAKHIGRLHGFDASSGCAYYRGHGRQTAMLWAAFRAELAAHTHDPAAEHEALRAAVATFEAMRLWLVHETACAA